MLLELYEYEQPFFSEHPQLPREDLERTVQGVPPACKGENVILGVRAGDGLAGSCWFVLFDTGPGLDGAVTADYEAEEPRREGVGTR